MVFDQVGGQLGGRSRRLDELPKAVGEVWEVFTLQPRPDGTFAGESNQLMPPWAAPTNGR